MPKLTYTKDELDQLEFELTELNAQLKKLTRNLPLIMDDDELIDAKDLIIKISKFSMKSLGVEFALATMLQLIIETLITSMPKLREDKQEKS